MQILLMLVFLVSGAAFLVGLAYPPAFQPFFRRRVTRRFTAVAFGSIAFGSVFLYGLSSGQGDRESRRDRVNASGASATSGRVSGSNVPSEAPAESVASPTPEAVSPLLPRAALSTPSGTSSTASSASHPSAVPTPLPVVVHASVPAPEQTPAPEPTSSPTPPSPPTPAVSANSPALQARVLTGVGRQVSTRFDLPAGVCFFGLGCQGQSNFIVRLLDSGGESAGVLANHIGGYSGSRALRIHMAGTYLLNVDAAGPWQVNVLPLEAENAPATRTFSGRGPLATALFSLPSGLITFRYEHVGGANFIVRLLQVDGYQDELLANEIGACAGSHAERVAEGIYILDVQAEGGWRILVE